MEVHQMGLGQPHDYPWRGYLGFRDRCVKCSPHNGRKWKGCGVLELMGNSIALDRRILV